MPAQESTLDVITEKINEASPDKRSKHSAMTNGSTKRQSSYAVILHNDSLNTMEYVVGVLRKVFHYGRTKAIWLMLKAHVSGKSIVWSGSLEVAEWKAEQLKSCGPDPVMRCHGAAALHVTVEALPQ